MTVFQARASGGEEGFDKLGLAELAKKAEGITSNVLVRVLQVISDTVANQRYQRVLKYVPYVGA